MGVARAAVEWCLFSIFHWWGDGLANLEDCFSLLLLLVSVPIVKKTENVLIFVSDAHTGAALPTIAGFKVFFFTSR